MIASMTKRKKMKLQSTHSEKLSSSSPKDHDVFEESNIIRREWPRNIETVTRRGWHPAITHDPP